MNFRSGTKFYSIYLDGKDSGYVTKGNASFYDEPLEIDSSVSSEVFQVDSVGVFVQTLERLKNKPLIRGKSSSSFPRVEVYYKKTKVYDAYKWDGVVLNGFELIMPQLPKGFNPFGVDEDPFDLKL